VLAGSNAVNVISAASVAQALDIAAASAAASQSGWTIAAQTGVIDSNLPATPISSRRSTIPHQRQATLPSPQPMNS
jgi:hypothetical protein